MERLGVCLVIVLALCVPCATVSGQQSTGDEEANRQTVQADRLFDQGHTAEAKEICDSLMQTLPDKSAARAFVLNLLSKIYASEGAYERAINSARQSADAKQTMSDP